MITIEEAQNKIGALVKMSKKYYDECIKDKLFYEEQWDINSHFGYIATVSDDDIEVVYSSQYVKIDREYTRYYAYPEELDLFVYDKDEIFNLIKALEL